MRKNKLMVSMAVSAALAAPIAAHADGDTTIGGVMYADFTSVSTTQDDTSGLATSPLCYTNSAGTKVCPTSLDRDPNGLGTDVKRMYFIVNHTFDDVWSVNLTTDFSGGAPNVFIKKAYVQGKFSDMTVFRLGSADMPWIPYVEGIYGYRFFEKTLIDRGVGEPLTLNGKTVTPSFGNSADWGANLNGNNGTFNYSVSVVNGGGYKNPARSKSLDFEGRVGFVPVDGLTIALGYYTGKLDQDTEAAELTADNNPVAKGGPLAHNTANRTDALVDWKANGLNVGLEYFTAKNFNAAWIFSNTTDSENGYSLFGSYDLTSDYSIFARYDNIKPSKDQDSTMEDKYYNAGFAWKSNANITWALGYKSEKLTDNLARGSSNNDIKTSEVGLWAQVKY